jgi:hypothetical protein
MRCPGCGQIAMFVPFSDVADVYSIGTGMTFGQRRCPDLICATHVFVVLGGGLTAKSYPRKLIEFNQDGIPAPIIETFGGALACHADGIYVAAAIMIRRTLEELCADRGATGADLSKRIANLSSKVILPVELFDGLTHLRFLGNDAAHIEAKTYTEVGQAEVEVAIEITKEILKAVYQLDGLVSKLKALQKPASPGKP